LLSIDHPRKFCLDANLSYGVAEALAMVQFPFVHVSVAMPQGATGIKGQSRTPDLEIAPWCALTEHVLVTCDEDFRGQWDRGGQLAQHGTEVIASAVSKLLSTAPIRSRSSWTTWMKQLVHWKKQRQKHEPEDQQEAARPGYDHHRHRGRGQWLRQLDPLGQCIGNGTLFMSSDPNHPTDAGQRYYGSRVYEDIVKRSRTGPRASNQTPGPTVCPSMTSHFTNTLCQVL
jgi:hypothetical protein